ncbi:MAG: YvcK family protein [Candidatus Omnitrophota bacterium]
MNIVKWLYPGMGIKRWILVVALGIIMIAVGGWYWLSQENMPVVVIGGMDLIIGIILVIIGTKRIIHNFINAFLPGTEDNIADIVYKRRQLRNGPRLVAIGGGTGLSVLLTGLKKYSDNITAVVTVADDGGSSGRLREQYDILPPGDIRNCLVALADTEPLMRDLFQFRFDEGGELAGHSFGNLFIMAMSRLTGDFQKAIEESSKVLAIRGRVIPSTLNKVVLSAQLEDGSKVMGQANIADSRIPIEKIFLVPEKCRANEEALKAVRRAKAIVLSAGSLFTSILPNLLVEELRQEIINSRAIKIYVCNVMTQNGETSGFKASDHLKALIKHTHPELIDYVIVNKAVIPAEFIKRYKEENAFPVEPDTQAIERMGYKVMEDEVISTVDYIRHDSEKLARIINRILKKESVVF